MVAMQLVLVIWRSSTPWVCGVEIDEKIDYSSFLNNHEENVYLLFVEFGFANSPKVKSSLKNAKFMGLALLIARPYCY